MLGSFAGRLEPLEPRCLLAANQFAVIGDYGSDTSHELAVANLVKSWDPAYVVTVGDNDYSKGVKIDATIGKYYAQFIGNYHGSYGSGSATNRFFPALGNHDWDDGAKAYLAYFTLPGNERYYDFVQGSLHFFIVDSDSHEPDGNSASSKQGTWLRNALAASTSTFDIVVFHHTAYSSSSSTTGMRWPFKEWGADLVMAGHVHNYERLIIDGLTYLVDGTGGESLRSVGSGIAGSQVRYASNYGGMRFTVNGDSLVGEFFAATGGAGTRIDQFTISGSSGGSALPTLAVADAAIDEGDSGQRTLSFTVSLSSAATQNVTVAYATQDGTATTANNDYVQASGVLTFTPGVTSRTAQVVINGDTALEADETFTVKLSSAVAATITDDTAVGTIRNDEPLPGLSIGDVTVSEGLGDTLAVLSVQLSAASSQTVTVRYATANGSATSGSDYQSLSGTLTFAPNVTSQPLTTHVVGDLLAEPDEAFTVALSSPTGATIGDGSGTVTILNDDTGAVLAFQDGVSPTAGYAGTRDTRLRSSYPTNNYGTASAIPVDGSPDDGALLYWDLSSIPAGAIVQNALLELNVSGASIHSYMLYEAQRSWSETQATWTVATAGVPWATPGAQAVGADRGATVLGVLTSPQSGAKTFPLNADGLAVLQAWIRDPSRNFGFVVQNYDTATDDLEFSSSENSTQTKRPKLTVAYQLNQPPTVNAGSDQNAVVLEPLLLDGVVSDDGLPNPPAAVSVAWTTVSGPGTVAFDDPAALHPVATCSLPGDYVLRLSANDGSATSFDDVTVIVSPGNVAPSVDAGPGSTIEIIAAAVLDGTVTDDGLPDPPAAVTKSWSKQSGPGNVVFGDATAEDTTATFSGGGTYVLRLTAGDGGATAWDEVTVLVDAPPNVDAGPDRSIEIAEAAALDGTVSDDGLPNPPGAVTNSWSKQSGPGNVSFANASAVDTTATFDALGTYVLRLTGNDGFAESFDEMTVVVSPVNVAPSVDAGLDQSIDISQSALLDGTVSDDDLPNPPAAVTTSWSKLSGPGDVAFVDAAAIDTSATFSVRGSYVLQLEASDGKATTTDTVAVTVTAPNAAPIVSAGPDALAPLALGAVLDGTVTDDGQPEPPAIISLWSVVSGPGSVTFGDATAVDTTAAFSGAGEYTLRLSASDGDLTVADELTLTVLDQPPNSPPLVNAGPDLGTPISSSAVLHGSASDDSLPDPPGMLTYAWSQVDGPGVATFASGSSLDTSVSFSQQGDYVLRLTASDGEASVSDDATVTVTAPVSSTLSFQDGVFPSTAYSGTRDTHLRAESPGSNSATNTKIVVNGSPDFGGLIQWDIMTIPTNAIVLSATVTLHVVDPSVDAYSIYQVLRPWVEDQATWNVAQTGVNWQVAGADGPADRDTTVLGTVTAPGGSSTTVQLNAAGVVAVQQWVSNPSSNHGIIIANYNGLADALNVSSSEHSTAAFRPLLSVSYYIVPAAGQALAALPDPGLPGAPPSQIALAALADALDSQQIHATSRSLADAPMATGQVTPTKVKRLSKQPPKQLAHASREQQLRHVDHVWSAFGK